MYSPKLWPVLKVAKLTKAAKNGGRIKRAARATKLATKRAAEKLAKRKPARKTAKKAAEKARKAKKVKPTKKAKHQQAKPKKTSHGTKHKTTKKQQKRYNKKKAAGKARKASYARKKGGTKKKPGKRKGAKAKTTKRKTKNKVKRDNADTSKSVGNPVKVEGRGNTGRTKPNNLKEQMAMHQVQSNPLKGAKKLPVKMTDKRWPSEEGWVKMQNVITLGDGTKVNVHFVYNKITGKFDDFKFK